MSRHLPTVEIDENGFQVQAPDIRWSAAYTEIEEIRVFNTGKYIGMALKISGSYHRFNEFYEGWETTTQTLHRFLRPTVFWRIWMAKVQFLKFHNLESKYDYVIYPEQRE